MNKKFVFDFDSTFVKIEVLDELANICLKRNEDRECVVAKIKEITKLGMEGKISFAESLTSRLKLFFPSSEDIQEVTELTRRNISDSFLRNKNFFEKNYKDIYIVSGGFCEVIVPIVSDFGIMKNHVLANEFVFDDCGNFCGVDNNNPLSQSGGKIKAIQALNLHGEIFVIGDGFTDYQIKEAGVANNFVAFVENVFRSDVANKADFVAKNMEDFLEKYQLN